MKQYTKEEEAIRFVTKAFSGKKRIKEDIDMSFHSITVGFILKNMGCSEEVVLTGLLHDIIEDTSYGYDDIEKQFGKKVANNVLKVTEDNTITDWKMRKNQFIINLSKQSRDIILVELADKLHNLLSNYDEWLRNGNDAIATLKITYDMNKWYYLEMLKLFESHLDDSELLDRYRRLCNIYFN